MALPPLGGNGSKIITPIGKDGVKGLAPKSKDNKTGLPPAPPTYQVVWDLEGAELTVGSIFNCAPFNNYTEKVRTLCYGKKLIDLSYGPVIGSKLTTNNYNYILKGYGAQVGDPNGRIQYGGYYNQWIRNNFSDGKTSYNSNTSTYGGISDYLPNYMVLPNCVGGARGRYQELIGSNGSSFPNSSPPGYWNSFPEVSTTAKNGYVKVGPNFYVYTKNGGLWGKGLAAKGAPPLPGAMVTWYKNDDHSKGHIEFIEAVYNFGSKNEYIITTTSGLCDYSGGGESKGYKGGGILNMVRRNKYGYSKKNGQDNLYGFSSAYSHTTFLYTPLCNFDDVLWLDSEGYEPGCSEGYVDSEGKLHGLLFNKVTLNYAEPTSEQKEAYQAVQNALRGMELALKPGDTVQIEQIGNLDKNGTGKKINRLLGRGKVKTVHDVGIPYPYEIVDDNNKLIGFYTRSALKLIQP